MTFDQIALLILLLPLAYVLGHRLARHLWHDWLACWFTTPLPYTQPDPISRARFKWAFAWKRGAFLPPRVSRRRREDDKGPALGVKTLH